MIAEGRTKDVALLLPQNLAVSVLLIAAFTLCNPHVFAMPQLGEAPPIRVESGQVSQQIAADKLPKGTYRIEVEASDSAGRTTPCRTATFTIH